MSKLRTEDKKKAADVIIPVYRPDERLFTLLERLAAQTVKPRKIILVNTGREIWEKAGADEKLLNSAAAPLSEVYHVTETAFDHGGTRNLAVRFSAAPYFVMMTQDAVPADRRLLENLLSCMDGRVKMSYARQLPRKDADLLERFSRRFNYGPESRTRTEEDLPELGIKTWFASDVCAAYEREAFDAVGGFVDHTVFNEDMIFCAELLKAGYAVRYCAEARVIHSHHYTGLQQLRRNFDLAVSQTEHPEVFAGVRSESEGVRMVLSNARWLVRKKRADLIPDLIKISACKYLGYRLGKAYRVLPPALVKKISTNRNYWK